MNRFPDLDLRSEVAIGLRQWAMRERESVRGNLELASDLVEMARLQGQAQQLTTLVEHLDPDTRRVEARRRNL